MRIQILTLALLLGGCSAASQPLAAPRAQPVVIELFQSQGCSSCPPALAVLDEEANRPDVIALNFAVTYWDQLGWKDRFARPEFTARQWDYARAGGRSNVQTPQLIIGGATAVLGSRKPEVDRAIAAAPTPAAPDIVIADGKVRIGNGAASGGATVWLVSYDPRAVRVPIVAGENNGRTLLHRNIVTQLQSLGTWTGAPATYALPAAKPGLARALIVQQDHAGPILAARKV